MKNSAIEKSTIVWCSAAIVWFVVSWFAWITAVWSITSLHGSWLLLTSGLVAVASIALRWPFLESPEPSAWGTPSIRVGHTVLVLCYGAIVCWVGAIVLSSSVVVDSIPALLILGLVELGMLRVLPRAVWSKLRELRVYLINRVRIAAQRNRLGQRFQSAFAHCKATLSAWINTVSRVVVVISEKPVTASEKTSPGIEERFVAPEPSDDSIDLELESKLNALAGMANVNTQQGTREPAIEPEQPLRDDEFEGGEFAGGEFEGGEFQPGDRDELERSHEEELPGIVLSRCTEGLSEQGQRFFTGETHLELSERQTNSSFVIPFCPAFARPPEVEVECDDEDVECRIMYCTPTGARIAIRRSNGRHAISFIAEWYASLDDDSSDIEAESPSRAGDASVVSDQKMLLP